MTEKLGILLCGGNPRGTMSAKNRELLAWLAPQCQRLSTGRCYTIRCLKRGGYRRGRTALPVDADMSTCEPFELTRILKGEAE